MQYLLCPVLRYRSLGYIREQNKDLWHHGNDILVGRDDVEKEPGSPSPPPPPNVSGAEAEKPDAGESTSATQPRSCFVDLGEETENQTSRVICLQTILVVVETAVSTRECETKSFPTQKGTLSTTPYCHLSLGRIRIRGPRYTAAILRK